jgi:hypothetical protein
MFLTTFKRYQEHITHLAELQTVISENGCLVEKEYVKGRANVYVHPAIGVYNQTSGAADKTAQLLLKYIVAPLNNGDESGDAFDIF